FGLGLGGGKEPGPEPRGREHRLADRAHAVTIYEPAGRVGLSPVQRRRRMGRGGFQSFAFLLWSCARFCNAPWIRFTPRLSTTIRGGRDLRSRARMRARSLAVRSSSSSVIRPGWKTEPAWPRAVGPRSAPRGERESEAEEAPSRRPWPAPRPKAPSRPPGARIRRATSRR